MLTTQEELDTHLVPVMRENGFEIPPIGCFIAAAEFDEDGKLIAYQMIQNAVFLEGLWAENHSAHLRNLHNMATKYATETLNVKRIMTMTRRDETGKRIGCLAQALGFEDMNWNVFRRKF